MSMQLPRDGQEYAHLTFTGLPVGATVQASLDRATWSATTAGTTDQERRLLLRGPDSPATGGLLITDRVKVWVRVMDTPEQIVRYAGEVGLV